MAIYDPGLALSSSQYQSDMEEGHWHLRGDLGKRHHFDASDYSDNASLYHGSAPAGEFPQLQLLDMLIDRCSLLYLF